MKDARKMRERLKHEYSPESVIPNKKKALLIADNLMRYVVDMLRRSRECSRMRTLEMGTNFLFDWKNYSAFQSEREEPQIRFAWCDAAPVDRTSILGCAVDKPALLDINNARLFDEPISARQEPVIESKYPVVVTENICGRQRMKAAISERKELTRFVNLLKLPLRFTTSFTYCNFETILAQHVYVQRHIYRFGLVPGRIFIARIRYGNEMECGDNEADASLPQENATAPPHRCVEPPQRMDLIPGVDRMKALKEAPRAMGKHLHRVQRKIPLH